MQIDLNQYIDKDSVLRFRMIPKSVQHSRKDTLLRAFDLLYKMNVSKIKEKDGSTIMEMQNELSENVDKDMVLGSKGSPNPSKLKKKKLFLEPVLCRTR